MTIWNNSFIWCFAYVCCHLSSHWRTVTLQYILHANAIRHLNRKHNDVMIIINPMAFVNDQYRVVYFYRCFQWKKQHTKLDGWSQPLSVVRFVNSISVQRDCEENTVFPLSCSQCDEMVRFRLLCGFFENWNCGFVYTTKDKWMEIWDRDFFAHFIESACLLSQQFHHNGNPPHQWNLPLYSIRNSFLQYQ